MILLAFDEEDASLQLWLTPRDETKEAFFRGTTTDLRYLGQEALSFRQQRWLARICSGLRRVERSVEWQSFLEAAARQSSAPAMGLNADRRVTSGDAALLRVTTRCQARCDFCSSQGVLHDLVEDLPTLRKRVARAVIEGRRTVSITGGEPTLRRDLPELIAAARKQGISGVELQTNGILLARASLVDALAESGCTSIFLSLHSCEPQLHDEILHVPGAYDKAMRGARNCMEAGLGVCVNHVMTRRNITHLASFVENVIGHLGPVGIRLSFMAPEGWGASQIDLMPRLSEAAAQVARAIDIGSSLGADVRVPGLCGIPACLLPGYEEHFEELLDEVPPPVLVTRRKVEACGGCVHEPRCSGFWNAYLERHGVLELGPGRGDRSL
jgi:pyruvate-formate lyase-activating enzyme